MSESLLDRRCRPCEGGVEPLGLDAVTALLAALHSDWQHDVAKARICRRFEFANFSRTIAFTNAVAWIAVTEGHHPEMTLGYGYCEVRYRTSAIDGLSDNDFICAARVDRIAADA